MRIHLPSNFWWRFQTLMWKGVTWWWQKSAKKPNHIKNHHQPPSPFHHHYCVPQVILHLHHCLLHFRFLMCSPVIIVWVIS
jgi:hypothetical protein